MAGIIQRIFKENWHEFLKRYTSRVRPVVKEDVQRMMDCGDIRKGYKLHSCTSCDEEKKVAFTCKSRFCSSCGKVYVDNRAENMTNCLIRVKHRHMVFTIPEELRIYFRKDRKCLSILPRIAYDVLKRYFHGMNKKEKFTPGVVSVIHTFGRDLKWNPHVHLLVTEGAMGLQTEWKQYNYFHYERLRKSWQKGLLDALAKTIKKVKKEYSRLRNKLYAVYTNGFYVYGERVVKNSKAASDRAEGVVLQNGDIHDAQLILVSTGIRSNMGLVKGSAETNRGIIVNEKMETSLPDIYAAGDVAEFDGRVAGLYQTAIEQGKVAGSNAVGDDRTFSYTLAAAQFSNFDIEFFSVGETVEDENMSSVIVDDLEHGKYSRLFFKSNVLVGGMLFGEMGKSIKIMNGIKREALRADFTREFFG
jgi:hypothetical protein